MRQCLGKKKVNKLRKELGLDILHVMVRGGTNHRKDLCIRGGEIICYWPQTGEMKKDDMRWEKEKTRKIQQGLKGGSK